MKKIYRNFTNKKEILDSLILNEKKGVNIKIQNTKNKFVNKVIKEDMLGIGTREQVIT